MQIASVNRGDFFYNDMNEIQLSNRLAKCASFVNRGDIVADIGADHGYLGIFLVLNKIASFVYASDLREKPIANAIRNAERYGVSEKMSFLCKNGLDGIEPETVNSIICAGMGADSIIEIINRANWTFNDRYRLILQPQSSTNELRKFLAENGFRIESECLARDGEFIYSILACRFCGEKFSLSPGYMYVSESLLKSGDELLPQYLLRIRNNLEMSVEHMGRSVSANREKLKFFEDALKEVREMEETL